MTESENPFESPAAAEMGRKNEGKNATGKMGLLALVVFIAIVGSLDFGLLGTGISSVFYIPLFFSVLSFCSVMAATREGSRTFWTRCAIACFTALFTGPCMGFLLLVTCGPAAEMMGMSYDLHDGFMDEDKLQVGLLTFVMIALAGLLIVVMSGVGFKRSKGKST